MARINLLLHKLDAAMHRLAVAVVGDDGAPVAPSMLSTGSAQLDGVLEGGLPRGRIVEVFGAPGSGKGAFSNALIAHAQQHGENCALIDVEQSFHPARARAQGVSLQHLAVARPTDGEQALQLVEALVRARAASLVVVDSVAALLPRAELKYAVGEAPAGLHARMMSQGLRRIAQIASTHSAVVVFLNQLRTTFDDAGRAVTTTSGGHALHFFAAVRLQTLATGLDGVRMCIVKGPQQQAHATVALVPQQKTPTAGVGVVVQASSGASPS